MDSSQNTHMRLSSLTLLVQQSVPIKEIKSAKYSNVSLMPEVFHDLLKPQEIADLVVYLTTEKVSTDQLSKGSEKKDNTSIPPHISVDLRASCLFTEEC